MAGALSLKQAKSKGTAATDPAAFDAASSEDEEQLGSPPSSDDEDLDAAPDSDSDATPSGSDDEFGDDEEFERDDEQPSPAGRDSDDEEGPTTAAGGVLGGKQTAIAKAFAKILSKQPSAGAAPGSGEPVPILMGSKSVAKRKAEQDSEDAHTRTVLRRQHEMRQRGHVLPGRRGENPAADAQEKALSRSATRGVVRLFNAVAGAQRQRRTALAATGAQLAAARASAPGGSLLDPGAGGAAGRGTGLIPAQPQAATGVDSDDDGEAQGWEVLQKSFTGTQGGGRMRDWDQAQHSDEEDEPSDSGDDE